MNGKRSAGTMDKLMTDHKRLIENFFSLSFLQATNYVLPLVTLPYLVRVLEPSGYGLVMFAQALGDYFIILIDYGFFYSAPRKISVLRDDPEKVGKIFNAVLFTKGMFTAASLLVMLFLVVAVPIFRANWLLYIFVFGIMIGRTIFPTWFFQGMEKMKYITFLSILAKVIFTVAIFVFIKKQSDYVYVPLVNSLGSIISGCLGLWFVAKHFGVRFKLPPLSDVTAEIKDGWHIFISTVTASVYTAAIPLFLGFFTNYQTVGYYSAGERIVKAIQQMLMPFSQAVYPHVSKMRASSAAHTISFLRKLAVLTGSFSIFVTLCVIIFAPLIGGIVLGNMYAESILVMRILSLLIFFTGLGHIFIIQTMLNFGDDRAVFGIVLSSTVSCLMSVFIFVPAFRATGAAISAVVPEFVMIVLSGLYVAKKYNFFKVGRRYG